MAIPEYKLSVVLSGHSLDVRGLACMGGSCILSASRDKTAKLWHPEGVKDFANTVTYKGHKNFVSTISWVPPCEYYPEGLVVTGSNDHTINCYNLQDGTILLTLNGHENTVSAIAPGKKSGTILSGSWDCNGRLWNINSPNPTSKVFKGHQAAVWSIIQLSNGNIATASADKTIGLWSEDGSKVKSLTGHTDCVRCLVVSNNDTFLSCANDASIKLWSNKGECLNTFYGHTNYIYSLCMNYSLSLDSAVSCGEDGRVLIWKGSDFVTLVLPVQSVWCVTCLDNGDIVTGASDGLIRVFTRDPLRYTDEQTMKVFEEEVQKFQDASTQEIGGYKLSELPGPEVLFEPGKSDGQTKLVRRGTNVKCYSWNAAKATWDELGDVMGAAAPTEGKTSYKGKEYDYVFSVDIQEGTPPLKLPYNKTEDPWLAAQKFIHENELPQVYLEQVANFIITNSNQANSFCASNGVGDPFTGESRYMPSASNAIPKKTTSSGQSLVPHKSYLKFEQGNLNQILLKLREFNSRADQKFTDKELEDIIKLGETNASGSISDSIENLKKLLEWPKDILFPVLDITRLAVRRSDVNAKLFDNVGGTNLVQFLVSLMGPDNSPANQMLATRILVNAFTHLPGEMAVLTLCESIIHTLLCLSNINKNTQIAACSLLLNLCVALGSQPDATNLADCALHLMSSVDDNEAYFRALVGLGTLLSDFPEKIQIQSRVVANSALHNRLKRDAESSSTDNSIQRVYNCSRQIVELL